jgi:hypothetical protein
VIFVLVRSRWAVSLSTVGISLSATVGCNISIFCILMINCFSLDDVGCIVWMDPRDIRYKECVINFVFNGFGN